MKPRPEFSKASRRVDWRGSLAREQAAERAVHEELRRGRMLVRWLSEIVDQTFRPDRPADVEHALIVAGEYLEGEGEVAS